MFAPAEVKEETPGLAMSFAHGTLIGPCNPKPLTLNPVRGCGEGVDFRYGP